MKRIVAALSVVALISCGTAEKQPEGSSEAPNTEQDTNQSATDARAAKGAVGGAAFGAIMCLGLIPMGLFSAGPLGAIMIPVAVACLPVGALAGAVVGGTVAAVTSPSRPEPVSASAQPAAEETQQPEWRLVGTIEKAELLPEGVLHVARSRVTGGKEARARLLIDFNAATDKGERSYLGHASANCENDSIRIYFSQTFSEYGANGWRVSEGPIEPELLVQHPQAPLRDAVKLICE